MKRLQKIAFASLLALPFSLTIAHAHDPQSGQMMGQQQMMGQGMMNGQGMGSGMMGTPMMQGQGMGMGSMMGGPGAHIEGRLAFLKTELKITSAQEKVWNTFAEAMRESAGSMQAMHQSMMSGSLPETLPERIDLHLQSMEARLDSLKALSEAIKPLYNSLSAEQKETADSLMGMGMM